MLKHLFAAVFAIFLSASAAGAADEMAEGAAPEVAPAHAVAMHGTPKYGPDFAHFDYVNPDAPKGGEIRLASRGTFDSMNPFILKGDAPSGLGLVYETLMESSEDEAFSKYGLIAESIEMPEDRSAVTFNLRPEARWHDGKPLTAHDVVFSFNALMDKGHPQYRAYYANVKEVTAETDHRVSFVFDMAGNRELPLIMGELPVIPKHIWEKRDFGKTAMDLPVGSGPYKVAEIDPGRRVVLEKVEDWWGKDLPVNKGRYNFDRIVYDYYFDETVLLQALFGGEYDFRAENIAKEWATGYDKPPVNKGHIKKLEVPHEKPVGMQAFLYNTRRPVFADIAVRKALAYGFDFEWSNKQFAYGAYKRTRSFFENSELASSGGLPEGRELEILQELDEKYPGAVPKEVFTAIYAPPRTKGDGNIRNNLRMAKQILDESGWVLGEDGIREKDGVRLSFELIYYMPSFERWFLPFASNLKKLGVDMRLRNVDSSQYINRIENFDYDMTSLTLGQSLSPGNEQRDYWSSEKADVKGSRNYAGVKNPAVDELVDMIIAAPSREELILRTRALDRVLLWGHYVIPQWHINYHRYAFWDKFGRPETSPKYGSGVVDTWWVDPAKAAQIQKVMGGSAN